MTTWFLVLVVSAALLPLRPAYSSAAWSAAPSDAGSPSSASPRPPSRSLGLQRWVTLVPGISDDAVDPARRTDAEDRFELFHLVLGTIIGETIGYALTATFIVLVAVALSRTVLPHWLAVSGYVSAGLIVTGVVIPVLEVAGLTNFAGYVIWCAWLIAVAVVLVRAASPDRAAGESAARHCGSAPQVGP